MKQSSWFMLLYLFIQIVFMVIFQQIVLLMVGFISTLILYVVIMKKHSLIKQLLFILLVMLIAFLLNPLFNHRGMHILFYFMENPVTLESLWAGARAALIMGETLLLFGVFQHSMTAEDWQEILGRLSPNIALLFSLILSLCPRLTRKFTQIRSLMRVNHQKDKTRKSLEMLVSFSMEDAINMSMSMKARGYGLKKRTLFRRRRLSNKDFLHLALLIVTAVLSLSIQSIWAYAIFVNLPLILIVKEEITWKYYELKI